MRGIRAYFFRVLGKLPTKIGSCELCDREGTIRFFVAAKLPRPTYLCDRDYLRIRNMLEDFLKAILEEGGC